MKFELEPYNQGLSDDELLDDLRSVARKLEKDYVTKDEYNEHGRLCAATFQKRFGSWGKAHELAGLKRIRNFQATAKDCIDDIRRVAVLLKTNTITSAEYKIYGNFSLPLISRRVGSWKIAIEKADLKLSPQYHEPITDEQLFKNLEQLWETLGRQPKKADFVRPISLYSYDVYPHKFGSYRKALEAFIASFEKQRYETKNSKDSLTVKSDKSLKAYLHKTSRNISWRLRFLVMRRDDFKCKLCGTSPAIKPRTILHVDHIKAWSKGGETVMENLLTLCEQCNIGKSNLSMDSSSGCVSSL